MEHDNCNSPEEEYETETDEAPDHQQQLLAYIRLLKAEGVQFRSSSDICDNTDTTPRGFTLFNSRSSFGR